MKLCLNARLLWAVAQAVGNDPAPYYLSGVQIELTPQDGALLIATDGHTLLCAHDNEAVMPDHFPADGIILPVPREILAVAKKMKPADRVVWDSTLGLWTAPFKGKDTVAKAEPIDGTYPSWRRVVPTTFEAEFTALDKSILTSVDGRKVGVLGEIAALFGDRFGRTFLYTPAGSTSGTSGTPFLVRFSHEHRLFGLLMPCKFDAGETEGRVPFDIGQG